MWINSSTSLVRKCSFTNNKFLIFRVKKREGRNLTSDKYARNLVTFFDHSLSNSQTSITISGLQSVLLAFNQDTVSEEQTTSVSQCFRSGDYVATFWIDGNGKYEWFLGRLFVGACNDVSVLLSYFKKVGQTSEHRGWHLGISWKAWASWNWHVTWPLSDYQWKYYY